MSTLSSVREIRPPGDPLLLLRPRRGALAGGVVVGIEHVMTRAELARSRRQLAQLDERLLRDIGLDRATARLEATKGFWAW